jgi:thiol-disulfide isomerase/thioredoxin
MKNFILALSLFIITSTTTAAEINFLENPVWKTVLEKAKKEKKIIFFDAYATWCGPCKQMDVETYKDQAVADFYNTNFINVKYDMEKGEGIMLAQQFGVSAYPSLLFINAEGEMLHKGLGFQVAKQFLELAKTSLNPETQYYSLKNKAMELSNTQFGKLVSMAIANKDEDIYDLSRDYLAKQSDVLGSPELIDLIMTFINAVPNEQTLAYIIANKSKLEAAGKYSPAEVEQRIISLTLGYGLYQSGVKGEEEIDFNGIKVLLDKYVPSSSFFVYHYFRTQYLLQDKKTDEAVKEFNILLANTPLKIDFEQLCNAMMSFGPTLAQEGKLTETLTKFDAVQIPASEAKLSYMKDFVKGIIYIKMKQYDKFATIATALIANPNTPENVKADLRIALEQVKSQGGN